MRGIVHDKLQQLLETSSAVSSTELAQAAGISRQAAHKFLVKQREAGTIVASGQARACRYRRAPGATALHTTVRVSPSSAMYRLSARLLLSSVYSGQVTLDFTGVIDLGEEFLDEVFLVWAPAHPRVDLRVAHLPARFAPMLFKLARRPATANTAAVG